MIKAGQISGFCFEFKKLYYRHGFKYELENKLNVFFEN